MTPFNAQPHSAPLEFSSQASEAQLTLVDKFRQQIKRLTTMEQRYADSSLLLKGLNVMLIRTLAAHSAFSDALPDPQWIAHARFSGHTSETEANFS